MRNRCFLSGGTVFAPQHDRFRSWSAHGPSGVKCPREAAEILILVLVLSILAGILLKG